MSTARIKKALVGLLVLGALSAALGGSTFATFNATTTNAAGFQTAVLVLGNKVGSGVECQSSGASITANSATCSQVFTQGASTSGSSISQTVTLRNIGNNTGAKLKLTPAACSDTAAGFADTGVGGSGITFAGGETTGDMCSQVWLTVYDAANNTCVYPSGAGACPAPSAANTVGGFVTAYGASGYTTAANIAALGTDTFTFTIQVPTTLGNSYQGRAASTTLTWLLQ